MLSWRRYFMAVLIALPLAITGAVLAEPGPEAEPDIPEDACSVADPLPHEAGYLYPEWVYSSTGRPLPSIAVQALTDPTYEYWLEVRVQTGHINTTWTQGPYFADSLEQFAIPVQMPTSSALDSAQHGRLSRMVVRVVATDSSTGDVIQRSAVDFIDIGVNTAGGLVWAEAEADSTPVAFSPGPAVEPAGVDTGGPDGLARTLTMADLLERAAAADEGGE